MNISRSASGHAPFGTACVVQEKNVTRRWFDGEDEPYIKVTTQAQLVALGLLYQDIDDGNTWVPERVYRYMRDNGGSMEGYQENVQEDAQHGDCEGNQGQNDTAIATAAGDPSTSPER
jgi:hypothetical protein